LFQVKALLLLFALFAAKNLERIDTQGLMYFGLARKRSVSFRNFPKLSVSFRSVPPRSRGFR